MYISRDFSNSYVTNGIFLFFFMLIYCIAGRGRFKATILFVLNILPVCIQLDSNLLMIICLTLIFLPIAFITISSKSKEAGFINFFIPISIIVFCQLIGYKNMIKACASLYSLGKETTGIDFFYFHDSTILYTEKVEFEIFEWCFRRLYSLYFMI